MRSLKRVFCATFLLGSIAVAGHAQTIYDASLLTTPGNQGWNFTTIGFATETAPAAGATYTTLDTTLSSSTLSGYGTTAPVAIGAGTDIQFDLQLNSETHNNNNRAGLSVIAIGNNLSGLELGFWSNEIWAQNVGFTHGEGTAFDMLGGGTGLGGLNHFDLSFTANAYSLYANGGSAPILTGSLRNYSGFGFPYNVNNGLFVGDDTTSAKASFRLSKFAISSAPEPGSCLLMLTVCFLPVAFIWKNRKKVVPVRIHCKP